LLKLKFVLNGELMGDIELSKLKEGRKGDTYVFYNYPPGEGVIF